MFKAKIIENPTYYSLRRKLLILSTFAMIPLGFVSVSQHFHFIYSLIIFIVFIVFLIFLYKTRIKVEKLVGERNIQISEHSIEILGKSAAIEKSFSIRDADEIIVKEKYQFPEENISEFYKEMKGDNLSNYLIIKTNGKTHKFDFIIDSHYMILQLKKIINFWTEQDITITLDSKK